MGSGARGRRPPRGAPAATAAAVVAKAVVSTAMRSLGADGRTGRSFGLGGLPRPLPCQTHAMPRRMHLAQFGVFLSHFTWPRSLGENL